MNPEKINPSTGSLNESFRPRGDEKFDVYKRVATDAIIAMRMRGMDDSEIERAVEVLKDPDFQAEVKKGWDQSAYGSAEDPERQEEKWAQALAKKVIDRISH